MVCAIEILQMRDYFITTSGQRHAVPRCHFHQQPPTYSIKITNQRRIHIHSEPTSQSLRKVTCDFSSLDKDLDYQILFRAAALAAPNFTARHAITRCGVSTHLNVISYSMARHVSVGHQLHCAICQTQVVVIKRLQIRDHACLEQDHDHHDGDLHLQVSHLCTAAMASKKHEHACTCSCSAWLCHSPWILQAMPSM